jgi:hypothetical protein
VYRAVKVNSFCLKIALYGLRFSKLFDFEGLMKMRGLGKASGGQKTPSIGRRTTIFTGGDTTASTAWFCSAVLGSLAEGRKQRGEKYLPRLF